MLATMIIGPTVLKVSPRLPDGIFKKIQDGTSFRVDGYRYTPAYNNTGWNGYISPFKRDQTASSGLHYRIKRLLEKEGYEVAVSYAKEYPPKGRIFVHGFELEKFQTEMVEQGVQHRICILSAPVRGGKTAVISALANRIDQYPICVVTKYKDLAKQTCNDIAGHTQKPIGLFSESKFTPEDIWVTNYNALVSLIRWRVRGSKSPKIDERNKRVLDLIRMTKVIILDECQYAVAEMVQKSFKMFTNIGYKIGLSGTPRDIEHMKIVELESLIGPIVKRVGFNTLIESGRLAKPKVVIYDLPEDWYDMYLNQFNDVYQCNIVDNTNRNQFIAATVNHLHALGKSTFIMVRWKEHGRILRQLIPNSFFAWGGIDTDTRFTMYDAVQRKDIVCVIGTVGKVGLNLPRLDVVINAEGGSSNIPTVQKMRSLTASEGKKYGYIIDFIDQGDYLRPNSRARLKIYQGIDGFEVVIKKVPEDHFAEENHENASAA
jgi:superfamily II DNA or RNA helicase